MSTFAEIQGKVTKLQNDVSTLQGQNPTAPGSGVSVAQADLDAVGEQLDATDVVVQQLIANTAPPAVLPPPASPNDTLRGS